MNALPVILITGFLGSGKTTFVNNLLSYLGSQGKSVALLINEFGSENIDADLIHEEAAAVYEVSQGSIFCVCTRDQFLKALAGIANGGFDTAVIEATGIANTRDMGAYIDSEPLRGRISVRQNFCMIDAANFHKVYETLPAARIQAAEASVLVVNKTDLVETAYLEELGSLLSSLNDRAPRVRTTYAKVDFAGLLDMQSSWKAGAPLDETPPEGIRSVAVKAGGVYDARRISDYILDLSGSLMRAKGFIETENGPVVLQYSGNSLSMEPDTDGKRKNAGKLVLIGSFENVRKLRKDFDLCRIEPSMTI